MIRKAMKRIRGPAISMHEIAADIIFIIVGAILALAAAYIFDIHWSFYPGNTIFPPNKHIFQTPEPYYLAAPLGGLGGLIIFKLIFYAFQQAEEAEEEKKWEGYRRKNHPK